MPLHSILLRNEERRVQFANGLLIKADKININVLCTLIDSSIGPYFIKKC